MKFWKRLLLLMLLVFLGFALCMVVGIPAVFIQKSGYMVFYMHLLQWTQNLVVMMLVPLLWIRLVYLSDRPEEATWKQSLHELGLLRFEIRPAVLAFCATVCAIPLLDALEVLPYKCPLPDGLRAYCEEELLANQAVMSVVLQPGGFFGWVELVLLMCLSTAIGEEMLFRGALLRCFRQYTKLNRHAVAVLVGLVFALIHFELYGLIPRWLLGTVFVYAVYWTRSLWPAIIMHFTNNLVALIVFKTQDDPFNLADGKEFSFGPLMIVLSVALTGVLLWLLSSNKAQNPSANASV